MKARQIPRRAFAFHPRMRAAMGAIGTIPINLIMTRAGTFRRGRKAASAMQLDPARYRHCLASFGMADAEEERFMEQL